MKKLRWAMDGGFWDLDRSTPVTIDGLARPVPGDPLPLGLSRGIQLSRPKQVDFMQRFMLAPFVPAYAGDPAKGGDGFTLQRVITFPFSENWFASLLCQFNFQKLISSVLEGRSTQSSESSWSKNIGRHLFNKSLYALGFSSEFFVTSDDTLLVSSEAYGDKKRPQSKVVYHHKFPRHNLTVETMWPGLFIDELGTYWDVPFLMAIDLASLASDSGSTYHLSVNNNNGTPKCLSGDVTTTIPPNLLPGLCVKTAFSVKRKIDLWRSKAGKLKMVQPFDVFLSDPQISTTGIIGTVITAAFGDNSVRSKGEDGLHGLECFSLHGPGNKSALLADLFASISCTVQHGNFQRLFLDLTRFNARLDFPSGSEFLIGAARLAQDLYNSQPINMNAVRPICPNVTFSLQQQIIGAFSFRVDSKIAVDFKVEGWNAYVDDPVFAVEYALQVLGSAKAVAWYSPKNQEAMVELRFFET